MYSVINGYEHIQSVPATTWVVAHALKCKPSVQVFINYGGILQRVLPLGIQSNGDNSQITITFSDDQTGVVVLQ